MVTKHRKPAGGGKHWVVIGVVVVVAIAAIAVMRLAARSSGRAQVVRFAEDWKTATAEARAQMVEGRPDLLLANLKDKDRAAVRAFMGAPLTLDVAAEFIRKAKEQDAKSGLTDQGAYDLFRVGTARSALRANPFVMMVQVCYDAADRTTDVSWQPFLVEEKGK